MDALKKAELAKRQGAGTGADNTQDGDGAGGLALEPLAEPPAVAPSDSGTGADVPMSLASHLEELDARFLEEAAAAARQVPVASAKPEVFVPSPTIEDVAPAPAAAITDAPRRPVPETEDSQTQVKAAAQNLFAAKKPERQESRKGFAIAIGVMTVLSVTGIGGYFWWQLQPKNSLVARPLAAPPTSASMPPAAPTPAPAVAPAAAVASAPVSAPTSGASVSGTARPAATATADSSDAGATLQARSRRQAARVVEADEDDSPVRVTRQPLRVDPALNRGYEAFNRGELALAQLEYERARKNDPRNTDVLHGLAAIALRESRYDLAEALYRQIIESDPQDSVAIAALLNQRGHVDPGLTESRLKSLAATQPELAAPHFSLGNLYARQGRWSDAQQAYFRAFNAEPDNPDVIYNLAISLEHLRQNKLAAQYYAQAIAAANTRPAGFDRAQAAERLKSLQP